MANNQDEQSGQTGGDMDKELEEMRLSLYDLDERDGLRKSVKKRLKDLVCSSGKSDGAPDQDTTEHRKLEDKLDTSIDWDQDEYDFKHNRRGLAIIINNQDFSRSREFGDRGGSSYDASALYHSFRGLGFDVLLYDDLAGWKMVEVLRSAALEYDHANADCFACSILTHGDQTWSSPTYDHIDSNVRMDLLFGVDGKAVATKAVVEMFSDAFCPKLTGKPRFFFLQACRGNDYDHGQRVMVEKPGLPVDIKQVGTDNSDSKDNKDQTDSHGPSDPRPLVQRTVSSSVDPPEFDKFYSKSSTDAKTPTEEKGAGGDNLKDSTDTKTATEEGAGGDNPPTSGSSDAPDGFFKTEVEVSPSPIFQDCLVMYATPPGYYAWRRKTGAWFVQSLCKLLDSGVCSSMTITSVLTHVCGMVTRNYQSENPSNPSMHGKKEIPVIESMLVKDVFFRRKDAHRA